MTEAQGDDLIAKMAALIDMVNGLGLLVGRLVFWSTCSVLILLCIVFFQAWRPRA